ncbi:MAG: hypothetical protein MJZ68_00585 [archaeon]|nr:hypothetical protein [archaeon]
MVSELSHRERALASLNDEKVDRLSTYPIACGVCRRLVGDGKMTYREWANDPVKFASAFKAGQDRFGLDFSIGLMDLSVMAGDLGANVRMDEQNTPFVDVHLQNTAENYENLEVPDITKGRTATLIAGTELLAKQLKDQVVTSAFVEGPLLALTQTFGAENVMMDLFTDPAPIHKALETLTEYDRQIVDGLSHTGVDAICWDYLWGNYSCLGDEEYGEFEGDRYAPLLNKYTVDSGMANTVHSCADLPHLDKQIKEFKPSLFSLAYYPLIEGSPSPKETIEAGYADECLIAGVIDPQMFIKNTAEEVTVATRDLCHEVKTALCERGLNSRYTIATGCEVPPTQTCRLENIDAMVEAVRTYGGIEY